MTSTRNFQVSEVTHFNEDGKSLTLIDGRVLVVDAVIFATGFVHDYPFLNKNCNIHVLENRVTPLYKQIVNTRHPTMFFAGVTSWQPTFQIIYLQAVYISKVLAGEIVLPSVKEMVSEQSRDFMSSLKYDWQPSEAHRMSDVVLNYADYLADASGADRMRNYVKNMNLHVHNRREDDVVNYRDDTYSVEDFEL